MTLPHASARARHAPSGQDAPFALCLNGMALQREGVEVVRIPHWQLVRPSLVALLGASGAGKSTLLYGLGGFLPWVTLQDSSALVVAGQSLLGASEPLLTRLRLTHIGLMEQHLGILPHWSAERNVMASALLGGCPLPEAQARALAMLQRLELGAERHRSARTLSRGQRQKLALARVLLHPGKLLLLDEPDASLDARSVDVLLALLRARVAEGTTILYATHDARVAAAADVTLRIEGGLLEPANTAPHRADPPTEPTR